jgi:hypothetical protein
MISICIIFILLIVASISNAIMDVIDFKFTNSIFFKLKKYRFWFDASISWKNKYKNRDPNQGEAFFGSTTFLVFITDAWHFFKMIMLSCFIICIILGINYMLPITLVFWKLIVIDIIMFIILKPIYGIVFELFLSKIFVK